MTHNCSAIPAYARVPVCNGARTSKWAQGNVARAYAHLWQAFGDTDAEERFWRVRRKSTPDLKAVANRVEGDLAAYEVCLASDDGTALKKLKLRITHDVERIVANREPDGYFSDFRHSAIAARQAFSRPLCGMPPKPGNLPFCADFLTELEGNGVAALAGRA